MGLLPVTDTQAECSFGLIPAVLSTQINAADTAPLERTRQSRSSPSRVLLRSRSGSLSTGVNDDEHAEPRRLAALRTSAEAVNATSWPTLRCRDPRACPQLLVPTSESCHLQLGHEARLSATVRRIS